MNIHFFTAEKDEHFHIMELFYRHLCYMCKNVENVTVMLHKKETTYKVIFDMYNVKDNCSIIICSDINNVLHRYDGINQVINLKDNLAEVFEWLNHVS
jgi:hypothetical protein